MKRGEGGSSGGVERGVAWGGGAKWKEIVRVERGVLDVERSVTRGGSREEREVSTGDGERDQRKKNMWSGR
jgi:hypothetical protein